MGCIFHSLKLFIMCRQEAVLRPDSCECYLIIKDYFDNYTKFDIAITA